MFPRHKLSEFYRYQSRRYYKLFSALLHQKSGIAFRKEGKKRYDFRGLRRSIYRRRLLLLSLSSSTSFCPPLAETVATGGRQLPSRLSSLSLLCRGSLYLSSSALPPPIRLTGTSLCPIVGQDSRSRVSLRWQMTIPILMSSVITMTNDTPNFDRLLVFGYTLFTHPFPHIRNKQCCLLKRVNNSPLLLGFYPKQQLDVVKW